MFDQKMDFSRFEAKTLKCRVILSLWLFPPLAPSEYRGKIEFQEADRVSTLCHQISIPSMGFKRGEC